MQLLGFFTSSRVHPANWVEIHEFGKESGLLTFYHQEMVARKIPCQTNRKPSTGHLPANAAGDFDAPGFGAAVSLGIQREHL